MNRTISLYDTTLRDGSQRRGISYTLLDKLAITTLLDEFGVEYIEGGWPGSNPKDAQYFAAMKERTLRNAKVVAFGSTRRKGVQVEDDTNIRALLDARTPAVAVVGKTWQLHVERVLEVTESENLAMIGESVGYLHTQGREVIFDAEHFFDGYRDDPLHALAAVQTARDAGAAWIVLCDTNGGSLPEWIYRVVEEVQALLGANVKLGIHTHNDAELAVANALAAVRAGALQIQGTVNGYGERCGNCNLVSVLPTLVHKMGYETSRNAALETLTQLSRAVSEVANVAHDSHAPYVGASAFAHKGGIHVAAVEKDPTTYEHLAPEQVGNVREIVISELSGRGNIRLKTSAFGERAVSEAELLRRIKELESEGYQFENAEASFELLTMRVRADYTPPFIVRDLMVVSDERTGLESKVQAILKIAVAGDELHTAAEGAGPVHALDQCVRKALIGRYPDVANMRLVDYKVRILDSQHATAARVRVTIEAEWQGRRWCTVGCHQNIIKASAGALLDCFEYLVSRREQNDGLKLAQVR